jgi:hypothetical protein
MSHPRQTSSDLDDELKKLFPANDISRWRLLEWLKAHSKHLTIAATALIILLIALATQNQKEKQASSKMEDIKEQWVEPSSNRGELLLQLQPLLRQRPEGFSGWKGSLMQSALMLGQLDWVQKWRSWPCEKEITEIPELFLLWQGSSQASLLAAKSQLPEALSVVEKTLNEAGAASSEAEKMLLCQLYLQKAMLYQALEQQEKESQAWNELLAFLGAELTPSLRGAQLKTPLSGWQDIWVHSWSEDKTTLLDYIAYRLKTAAK